jgi:hypothetical protein
MKMGGNGMRLVERILVSMKSPDAKWSPAVAKATQLAGLQRLLTTPSCN